MRTRVVLGVLLALTAAGVVVTLSLRHGHVAGTNGVRAGGLTVRVPAHATACQPLAGLPSDSGAVALVVGTDGRPTPPLELRVLRADRVAFVIAQLPGGRREGRLTLPFVATFDGQRAAAVCVRNGGRAAIELGGEPGTAATGARVGHGPPQGIVALTFLRRGRASWWPLMGGIAHRFGLGKARVLGSWTLWAAAVALLGLWAAVAWLLLSERPR